MFINLAPEIWRIGMKVQQSCGIPYKGTNFFLFNFTLVSEAVDFLTVQVPNLSL